MPSLTLPAFAQYGASAGARRLCQHPPGPLVEAGAFALGRLERGGMHRRIDAQHQPPRGRLVGRLVELGAGVQVIIDRFMKRLLKLANDSP